MKIPIKKIKNLDLMQLISGFLAIIPIFIKIDSLEFLLVPFNDSIYTYTSGGIPVNFGFIFLFLTFFLLIVLNFNLRELKIIIPYLVFGLFWGMYNILSLGFTRGASLSIFYIGILQLYYISRLNIKLIYFRHGFLLSALIISILRMVQTEFRGIAFGLTTSARNFFGIELYQYWVSYSAVMSLIVLILPILFICVKRRSIYHIIFFIICISSVNEIYMTSRKSPILDLFLFSTIIFFFIARAFIKNKINNHYKLIAVLIFYIIVIAIGLIHSNQSRPIFNLEEYSDRIYTYNKFVENFYSNKNQLTNNIPNLDSAPEVKVPAPEVRDLTNSGEILSTELIKWGGYSNMFLEYYMKLGLMGLIFFLISLALCFNMIFYILFGYNFCFHKIKSNNNFYVSIIFIGFIISYLTGNILNLNQQLPLYVCGFLVILIISRSILIPFNEAVN